MTYERLRLEFTRQSFREEMKDKLGDVCVNCGSNENIEYHHIVPLKNGGTNNLSNIVPLRCKCHFKAHDKNSFKSKTGGRPKAIEFEEAEPILHRYYALEIGTKETKELLGLSIKNKTTLSLLRKQYEEKYNIKNFYNNIDLINSQSKRVKKIGIKLEDALPYLERFYKKEINDIECKEFLGLSPNNELQWGRLLKKYDNYKLEKEKERKRKRLEKEVEKARKKEEEKNKKVEVYNKAVEENYINIEPFKNEPLLSTSSIVNSFLKGKISKQDSLIILNISSKAFERHVSLHKVKYNIN